MMLLQFTGVGQAVALNGAPPMEVPGGPILVNVNAIAAVVPRGDHATLVVVGVQILVWESAQEIIDKLQGVANRSQLALPPGTRLN